MIGKPFDFLINGKNVLVTLMVPKRFTSATRRYKSNVRNSTSPYRSIPALFTTPHSPGINARMFLIIYRDCCLMTLYPQYKGKVVLQIRLYIIYMNNSYTVFKKSFIVIFVFKVGRVDITETAQTTHNNISRLLNYYK